MSDSDKQKYDAILVVSFGGPEKRDDVIPFLENVLRGKPVPRERMLEVAEHYYHFDGVSPINAQVREFIEALKRDLAEAQIDLPIYWGNRNWHPLLPDTIQQMKQDGVRRALAFMTSAYSSYSGCRQYRENLLKASEQVGEGAPKIDKLRMFYNHPGFISANVDRIRAAFDRLPPDARQHAQIAFTAHSIPISMSNNCNYVRQLEECCRLVAEALSIPAERWKLVYQSRSGRPGDPWLEPDIGDHIRILHAKGVTSLVIAPVGFISDHMEVMFDLDEEAKQICDELQITMSRALTVGSHPEFVACIRELIEERIGRRTERRAIGQYGPSHDVCPADCCLYTIPQRPPAKP
ncbi:ferrochelatase [Schlesneria paludicola]|uniref:ferrochelatase n=1 Tax=Schlesneria paludicola TaxID=360056 RepID=UPI00029B5188|nr:ferrochelatase [Schlesneria paludicola]